MKNHKIEIASFLIGCVVFVYLISQFGFDRLLENMQRAGWSLFYAICVWLVIYLLNTLAWKLALGDEGKKIGFVYLFLVTISGFVINYITPFLALGGEPYKVKKLAAAIGASHSLSAVVLYRMIHLLGHMLLLLTGIVAALLFLALPTPVIISLAAAGMIILAIILVTIIGHRHGIFRFLQNVLGKLKIFRKPAAALEARRSDIDEMDVIMTDAYRNHRGTFYFSLFSEYCSRVLMGVEVFVILRGINIPVTPVGALFVYIVYSIMINVFFFIPFNIGAREGGLYLALESLGFTPLLGIYFGIVMRIREFFWVLLGLLFILITTEKKQPQSVSV